MGLSARLTSCQNPVPAGFSLQFTGWTLPNALEVNIGTGAMRKSNLLYLFPLSKASGFRKIRPNVWTKIWAKQLLPERSGRSRFVSVSFRAGDRPQRVQALGPAEERTPQRPNGGPYHRSSSGKDRFARQGGAAQTVPCARRALAGVTLQVGCAAGSLSLQLG